MKKRTKIVKKLLNNWALKLFSLVAAFLLWLLVMSIEDPEGQKTFTNIPVKLVNTEQVEEEGMVYEVQDKSEVVRTVYVVAANSILDELSASDIVAEADFNNMSALNTVEIRFYSLRYNDQIASISGSNEILKLNIEDKKTKRLALEVNTTGEVANGYMINDVSLDQNRLEVSGPQSVIEKIASAEMTVDVTDSTSNISTYADVILYDADGNVVSADNLSMNTNSVRVKVEILATKTVPIQYSVMGVPAAGYLDTGVIESDPDTVKIAGTEEALAGVNAIVVPEEALNITGQSEDMMTNINIEDYLPEGVILADSSFKGKVAVTVYIEKEASRSLNISADRIRITNVPAEYTVELEGENETYGLNVKGLSLNVDGINEALLYGHIDMALFMEERGWDTLNPGVYETEVEFALSESITIVQPVKVHIRISKTEESE